MTILIDNNNVTELRATNSAFVSASKSFNEKKKVSSMDRKYLYIAMLKNVNSDINVIHGDTKR